AGFGGEGAQVASTTGGDDALQQAVHRGPDALLGLAAGLVGDSHSGAFVEDRFAASISSTTRWARSRSACNRWRSAVRPRPMVPRKTVWVCTACAHTDRCWAWCVAWGQRAESHIATSGLVAPGVPG